MCYLYGFCILLAHYKLGRENLQRCKWQYKSILGEKWVIVYELGQVSGAVLGFVGWATKELCSGKITG